MTSQWCMCVHARTRARDIACACAPGQRNREREKRVRKQGMEGDKSYRDITLDHKQVRSYKRLTERHTRQWGTFITKNINTNNWRKTGGHGKHCIAVWGSMKRTHNLFTHTIISTYHPNVVMFLYWLDMTHATPGISTYTHALLNQASLILQWNSTAAFVKEHLINLQSGFYPPLVVTMRTTPAVWT